MHSWAPALTLNHLANKSQQAITLFVFNQRQHNAGPAELIRLVRFCLQLVCGRNGPVLLTDGLW